MEMELAVNGDGCVVSWRRGVVLVETRLNFQWKWNILAQYGFVKSDLFVRVFIKKKSTSLYNIHLESHTRHIIFAKRDLVCIGFPTNRYNLHVLY